MPRFKTDAIVLNTIDFMESDKIVCALTAERGLVHAIAKGAKNSRKRFPGTLEPFSEVNMEIFHKPGMDLMRIENASLHTANLAIRESLDVLAHGSVMLEVIMENLGSHDPSPRTYALLRESLRYMDPSREWFPVWAISMMRILETLGYGIVPGKVSGLSGESMSFLEKGSGLSPEILTKLSVRPASRRETQKFLLELCNRVSEKPLKSIGFLAKILDLDLNR